MKTSLFRPASTPRPGRWLSGLLAVAICAPLPAQAQPLDSHEAERPVEEWLTGLLPPEPTALFDIVDARARSLASESYDPSPTDLPQALAELDYSQYRAIRFRGESALWSKEALFEIQLFHPGFLYREPVTINVVDTATLNIGPGSGSPQLRTLEFDPAFFRYDPPAEAVAEAVTPDLGFAGFRVHFPINDAQYKDEFIVFQGASYFRIVGPGQFYGLSARGLAVDTAEPHGEEFPVFREFWLEKPTQQASVMVIHALLDSPSVTGAYRFEIHPGSPTEVIVDASLHARQDIEKLGIAPLTSMFLHGRNNTRFMDDFRPQVHDSDGLLVQTGAGEWIWRPLTNPRHLHVSSMADDDPRGFGLFQRDRDFSNYQDTETRYDRRPSLWVVPEGGWGPGRVELVEIPTDSETHDNITAYWVPDTPLREGEERRYRYRLLSLDAAVDDHTLGQVTQTRIGWAAIPGQSNPPPRAHRQFIVDFQGGPLNTLGARQPVEPVLETGSGEVSDLRVTRLPDDSGAWRASFKLAPDGDNPSDMRLYLSLRGQRLSEVWNYVWQPTSLD